MYRIYACESSSLTLALMQLKQQQKQKFLFATQFFSLICTFFSFFFFSIFTFFYLFISTCFSYLQNRTKWCKHIKILWNYAFFNKKNKFSFLISKFLWSPTWRQMNDETEKIFVIFVIIIHSILKTTVTPWSTGKSHF